MAATSQTPNYGFPIYKPGDTTSYLNTFNGGMTEIDSALKGVETTANDAAGVAGGFETRISQAEQRIVSLGNSDVSQQGDINNLESLLTFTSYNVIKANPGYSFGTIMCVSNNKNICLIKGDPSGYTVTRESWRINNENWLYSYLFGSINGNPVGLTNSVTINIAEKTITTGGTEGFYLGSGITLEITGVPYRIRYYVFWNGSYTYLFGQVSASGTENIQMNSAIMNCLAINVGYPFPMS